MVYHYRETDAVSGRWTGNTSGVKLSVAQADENTYTSAKGIADLNAALATSVVSLSSISQPLPNELTFHLSDGTALGPFTIPASAFHSTGAWAPNTAHAVNDTFYINGAVYLVVYPDPGQSSFSAGANDGLGHNYFQEMVPNPGNALATGGAAGMVYTKTSSTDFAATWRLVAAINVSFSPSTASGLTSTNVSAALEEIEGKIGAKSLATLSDVSFNTAGPVTGELLSYNGTKWTNLLQSSLSIAFSQITGSASASQLRDTTVTALGATGTVSLDPTLGDVFTITPAGGVALNAASAPAGARITVIVTTSGTSSFNITPGTGFISAGALATGTVSGKTFTISFIGDGTNLIETSRTAAM